MGLTFCLAFHRSAMELHVTTVIALPRSHLFQGWPRARRALWNCNAVLCWNALTRQTALLIFLQFGEKAGSAGCEELSSCAEKSCGEVEPLSRSGVALPLCSTQGWESCWELFGFLKPDNRFGLQACHAGSGALMLLLDSRDPLARPSLCEFRRSRAFRCLCSEPMSTWSWPRL